MLFLALAIFALYIWVAFLDPHPTPYSISLKTVVVASAAAAMSAIARAFTEAKGALVRSLIGYLLLVSATMLLIYDTNGINSPYIFMWTLAAIFAGLFGVWSSIPVFLVATGYVALLITNHSIEEHEVLPTILIVAVPIIFSVIVWSHVNRLSTLRRHYERDPTDYGQQSAEMSDLIARSDGIISAIGDGIIAVDSQEVVQLINPAAQTLLGWSSRDAISLQYQSILKLTDEKGHELSDVSDPVKQTLNTNQETRNKTLQLETKNGKKLFISLVASPLGESGSGAIVVIHDITKEHSEEHEQAEFISTASHEMRTPVASIEGYLGLALNPATATIDEKARSFITKAHESVQHLGRLFQDLLDVSKAEDGRLSNNPTVLDVGDFIGDVVEGLQQKATEKGLELVYTPAPQGNDTGERTLKPVFYANLDKDHVRELVSNLTENAIKYTPSGQVIVDVSGDNEHVTISVADSGVGIPAEDIPHLFQKFYRVDNSATREIGGTGLGLYLCRRLAETLGGRIWVESVYQQGSTFYIELPRLSTAEAQRLLMNQKQPDTTAPMSEPTPDPSPSVASTPAPDVVPKTPPAPTPKISSSTPPNAPSEPRVTQPSSGSISIPIRTNTPLSTIEQNPAHYTQERVSARQTDHSANRQTDGRQ